MSSEMQRGRLARAAGLCAVLALLLAPCRAADNKPPKDYALIFGTVWNAQQRPVQGVKVKIRRAQDKKAKWELVSDARGEFAQRVPAEAADYVVWAEPKGHKAPASETKVHINFNERQDIGLHLTE